MRKKNTPTKEKKTKSNDEDDGDEDQNKNKSMEKKSTFNSQKKKREIKNNCSCDKSSIADNVNAADITRIIITNNNNNSSSATIIIFLSSSSQCEITKDSRQRAPAHREDVSAERATPLCAAAGGALGDAAVVLRLGCAGECDMRSAAKHCRSRNGSAAHRRRPTATRSASRTRRSWPCEPWPMRQCATAPQAPARPMRRLLQFKFKRTRKKAKSLWTIESHVHRFDARCLPLS